MIRKKGCGDLSTPQDHHVSVLWNLLIKACPQRCNIYRESIRVLRHAANKQVPHKARQKKAGKSQYDCKYIQLHTYMAYPMCYYRQGLSLRKSKRHAFKTEIEEIEEKKTKWKFIIWEKMEDEWRQKSAHKHQSRTCEERSHWFFTEVPVHHSGRHLRSIASFICLGFC